MQGYPWYIWPQVSRQKRPEVSLKSAGLSRSLHGTDGPVGLHVPGVHLCTPTMAHTGRSGESEVGIFSHCLSLAISTKIQNKVLEEHYSTPLQQRMTGWIYCTNFSADFLQMSSGSSNSNQHLSELNWIAQYHIWNLLMGANFTLILIYTVQLPQRQMPSSSLWFGAFKVSEMIIAIHWVLGLAKIFLLVGSKCFFGTLFSFQGISSRLF